MDLVDRYFTAHHDDIPIDGLFSPDHKAKINGVVAEGPEAACDAVTAWREAFSGGRFEFMGRLVQGHEVAVTWRFHGVHVGPFDDRPASGAPLTMEGATRFTLKDGRIHRIAARWDVEATVRSPDGVG